MDNIQEIYFRVHKTEQVNNIKIDVENMGEQLNTKKEI